LTTIPQTHKQISLLQAAWFWVTDVDLVKRNLKTPNRFPNQTDTLSPQQCPRLWCYLTKASQRWHASMAWQENAKACSLQSAATSSTKHFMTPNLLDSMIPSCLPLRALLLSY